SSYTPDTPGNMCQTCPLFGGSLENNSWLKFVPSNDTAIFTIFIPSCSDNIGIQFGVYSSTGCNNFVLMTDPTWTSSSAPISPGSMSTIVATGLTPGQVYYIMIDGNAGDDCEYIIQAQSGFQIGASITPDQTICIGNSATIELGTVGIIPVTWSSNPYDPGLAGQEHSQSITVSPSVTTTYSVNLHDSAGFCTVDTSMSSTIIVLPASDPACDHTMSCTIDKTDATLCGGVGCEYSGPTILINEIMLQPSSNDGCIYGTYGGGTCEGEWIELFNPDPCLAIDISCYFLGNNTYDGGNRGGGFILPPGSIVPPLGFAIVRGRNATPVPSNLLVANGGTTIEVIVDNAASVCLGGGSRLWFPNAGGWFAFYDENGVAQDAISWVSQANVGNAPCNPNQTSCPYHGALANYNAIPAGQKTMISTVGPTAGQTFRRIPDGAAWQTSTPGAPTLGTCNSTCTVPPAVTCDGTATVHVTGNFGPYSYLWDDGSMDSVRTGLCAGVYHVTVSDIASGTTTTCSVEIFEPDPPGTSIVPTNTCPGLAMGAADLTVYTGNSPYIYNWSNSASTEDISNLSGGDFYVTVTDASNCVTIDTVTVVEYPHYTVTITPPFDSVCAGESAFLTASGGLSYLWSGAGVSPTTGANVTATPTVTTTYNVTATDGNSCTETANVVVSLSPNPVVAITPPSDVLCIGETTTLTASGADQYSWTGGVAPTTGSIVTATPTVTSTYSVLGTNTSGCTDTESVTVTVNPLPNIVAAAVPPAICLGESSVLTANNGVQYLWDPASTLSSATGNPVTATPTTTTTYTVLGTDGNSCTNNATVTVIVNPNPSIGALSDSVAICNGDSTNLTVYSDLPNTSFYWSPATGLTSTTGSNQTAQPPYTTVYQIIGVTPEGCDDTTTIYVNILPVPLVNFTYSGFGCSPVTAYFQDITNDSIVTWIWQLGDGTVMTNTDQFTHIFTATTNVESYGVSLWVENASGCTGELSVPNAISVYPMPEATLVADPLIAFPNQEIQFFAGTENGIVTWEWNFDYPTGAFVPTVFNEFTAQYANTGTYTVYLLVETNGSCTDTTTLVVEVVDIQIPNVFTPNGDGFNDYFIITNLEKLDNSNLMIFNRWGRKIFESDDYKNDWDGDGCSDGTYYYIVTLAEGTSFHGFITVIK
ncbi:MAG: gliding motility-associated C-terminal domain-containing protein, partial [Bacteroidetes bacterium]|nr:gliding motility-associated C-terminal domain-containing protein [Bacteroidota bacterium]